MCQDSGHGAIVNVSALHGHPPASLDQAMGPSIKDEFTVCSATRYVDESAFPGTITQDRISAERAPMARVQCGTRRVD